MVICLIDLPSLMVASLSHRNGASSFLRSKRITLTPTFAKIIGLAQISLFFLRLLNVSYVCSFYHTLSNHVSFVQISPVLGPIIPLRLFSFLYYLKSIQMNDRSEFTLLALFELMSLQLLIHMVDHDILLKHLETFYGVKGVPLSWF
jgi:hypothetical protein